MFCAAKYIPATVPPPFKGEFSTASDTPVTPAVFIEKITALLKHNKADEAFDFIIKCTEKFSDLPEFQTDDLKELTAKVMDKLVSLLSAEELRHRQRRLSFVGFQFT